MCESGYGHVHFLPQVRDQQYACAHHLMLAHARAAHLYRTKYAPSQGGRIGMAINGDYGYPASPHPKGEWGVHRARQRRLGA